VIGFLLKKFFFDFWDNLLRLAVLNLIFLAFCTLVLFSLLAFSGSALPQNVILLLFAAVGSIYLSGVASNVKKISDYRSFDFAAFFRSFAPAAGRRVILRGLVAAGIICIFFWVLIFILPFYFLLDSPIGLFIAALLFWVLVAAVLSLQFFLCVGERLDNNFFMVIKKCGIIFIDNPLFCIFCFLFSCILCAISLPFIFLIPGPAGILLFLDEALRLRLFKYDYLEKTGAKNTRAAHIPWTELLEEDREKTGDRTLKNFIFPWAP
jgi:hypothetical protein